MASETPTSTPTEASNAPGDWKAGVVAGLAGSLAAGALVSLTNDAVVAVAIPALYGLAPPPNPVADWIVHLFHGAAFGVAFAGLVGALGYGDDTAGSAGLGVAYGAVLGAAYPALRGL